MEKYSHRTNREGGEVRVAEGRQVVLILTWQHAPDEILERFGETLMEVKVRPRVHTMVSRLEQENPSLCRLLLLVYNLDVSWVLSS